VKFNTNSADTLMLFSDQTDKIKGSKILLNFFWFMIRFVSVSLWSVLFLSVYGQVCFCQFMVSFVSVSLWSGLLQSVYRNWHQLIWILLFSDQTDKIKGSKILLNFFWHKYIYWVEDITYFLEIKIKSNSRSLLLYSEDSY
jgi:hypothetical protein